MNLRVDLILPEEKRSGSIVNPRFLLKVAIGLVSVLLLGLIAVALFESWRLKSDLTSLETALAETEPAKAQAMTIADETVQTRAIYEEVNGWRQARIHWHAQLTGLLRHVPRTIQLHSLNIAQKLQVVEEEFPARVFTMTLSGKAVGRDAEKQVTELRQRLLNAACFDGAIEDVRVARFAADAGQNANKDDRVFELVCQYRPRMFTSETP